MLDLKQISPEEVHSLAQEFESVSLERLLRWAWDRFGVNASIGTSLQGAGIVMLHHAVRAGLRFPVFTVDTQFLFPETVALKLRLEECLGIEIESIYPEQTPQEQAAEYGERLWQTSPDLCCTLRKVLPLQKKLEKLAVWMTGLRREQSERRQKIGVLELYKFDVLRDHFILKFNPMANWSRSAIRDYIKAHNLPYNPLKDIGYHSIGCRHCTKAAGKGEDQRAGRWTGFDKSECGLHTFLGESI